MTRTLRQRVQWLACSTALVLVLANGCASSEDDVAVEPAAWLSDIERAHAGADRSDPMEASATLRHALGLPVPPEIKPAHRRVVQQDLLFRIAHAELDNKNVEQAFAAAERGLSLGREPDVFCANLWVVRGEALQALGRDTEAAASYYEALEINRKLLDQVLGAGDAGTP